MIITKRICSCCNLEFNSKYYHGGSIEHDNYTNDNNMKVLINRFNNSYYDKYKYRYVFLDSILLNGNFCEIKNYFLHVAMQIFECRLKWLRDHNEKEIVNYLEDNRKFIKKEFDNIKNKGKIK